MRRIRSRCKKTSCICERIPVSEGKRPCAWAMGAAARRNRDACFKGVGELWWGGMGCACAHKWLIGISGELGV
jgi:hypothetical protein